MVKSRLTATLQENLITILSYDDDGGRIVANMVDPALFESEYRTVAERTVDYWGRFKEAPKDHTPDLFADILEDRHNRRAPTFRRILENMLALSASVNSKYVIDQLRTFTRLQRFKVGVVRAAKQMEARQEMALDEVEEILNDLLRARELNFDPGTRLSDVDKVVEALSNTSPEFTLGVPELDRAGIAPSRGAAILFIGVKGTGKSWFCIHVGKQALMRRKRVLHISLEMPEEQVVKRYYQSLFSISKRSEKIKIPTIEKNSLGKIDAIEIDEVSPEFTMESEELYEEIKSHVRHMGTRLQNLIIKRFPTRELNPQRLEAYLDTLETVEGFIPDMVIIDYMGLMRTDVDNHRISLGRAFEELRGQAVRRNYALIVPHQSGRSGASSVMVKSEHVAEDWSLVGTADAVITITKTEPEKRLGLARLWISHSREENDAFGVLITQSYDLGQFVLDSVYLGSEYQDRLKEITKEDSHDDDEEE